MSYLDIPPWADRVPRWQQMDAVARAVGLPGGSLCEACITGRYPTPAGERLYDLALADAGRGGDQAVGSPSAAFRSTFSIPSRSEGGSKGFPMGRTSAHDFGGLKTRT